MVKNQLGKKCINGYNIKFQKTKNKFQKTKNKFQKTKNKFQRRNSKEEIPNSKNLNLKFENYEE